LYPVEDGQGQGNPAQILPRELWAVLGKYGKPVAVISHTGATGMGTDWDRYPSVDGQVENTVEIFQGARVSYEGLGAPQPTVGLRLGERYTADTASPVKIPAPPEAIEDFGMERNRGLYQYALSKGFHLGVFASSDHVAQHTSFGGVYVEEASREGIIRGLKARLSVAATDKIFVEFSCNGRPMGEAFETRETPAVVFHVAGTARLKRVTILRNEKALQVFESPAGTGAAPPENQKHPAENHNFSAQWADQSPLTGENRYYLRVEQEDGNMAWSSPVWVRFSR
jgi:hypothetical protein